MTITLLHSLQVEYLVTQFQQLTIPPKLKPAPLSAKTLAIVAQYLPLKEVSGGLHELSLLFKSPINLRTRRIAYQGRELEQLQLELTEWIKRQSVTQQEVRFCPSSEISKGLYNTQELDSLAPFFQASCTTMPLRRVVHAVQECCPHAESIAFTSCSQVGLRVMQHLSKFKKLQILRLKSCQELHVEHMQPLASMTSLTHLEIPGCKANDAALRQLLAPLKALTHLDLSRCKHITPGGVRALMLTLPALQQVHLAGNEKVFPWQLLSEPAVILPRGIEGSCITKAFLRTLLGTNIIRYASALAQARTLQITGKAHLIDRVKNQFGHCRGHAYATIISHCKMKAHTEKYSVVMDKAHIQFFQALEYLMYENPILHAPQKSEQEKNAIAQLEQKAIRYLKAFAGLTNKLHKKQTFTFTSPSFWADFWKVTRDVNAHMVELKLASISKKSCHSIVLFFKPRLVIADILHGIGVYTSRTRLEANLIAYCNNFGSEGDRLATVDALVLQNDM